MNYYSFFLFQTHSPRLTPKYKKTRLAPPPPVMKTSTPILENRVQQNSTDSLSSLTTDSGAKSMERSDLAYETAETDVEKEKIVKDEENRNRQSHDNLVQSEFCKLTNNYIGKF